MVLRRSRKSTLRRKPRAYRRRMNISGKVGMYKRKLPSLTVVRKFRSFNWTPSTASTIDFWKYLSQSASAIPNFAEYQALFDQYRVNYLEWEFRPRYDSFAGNDTTDVTLPGVTNQGSTMLHVIIDPKSQLAPSGAYTGTVLNSFLENGKVKTYSGNRVVRIRIKYPTIRDDINGSASYAVRKAPYLSCAFAGAVQHYGMHVFAQDVNLTGTFGQSWDVFCTMSVTFKGMN